MKSIDVTYGEITDQMRHILVGAVLMEMRVQAQGVRWLVELDATKHGDTTTFRFSSRYAELNPMGIVGRQITDMAVGPNGGTMLLLTGGLSLEVFGGGEDDAA